jgi:hypothetical protein
MVEADLLPGDSGVAVLAAIRGGNMIEGLSTLCPHSSAVVTERAIGWSASKDARDVTGFAADVLVGASEQEARCGVVEIGLLGR